jgi:hypothetical protein
MDAVIAMPARHQRRDHHLRSDRERLAHEILGKFRPDLDQHAADLMPKRKRPRQLLRPVALEDMQVGAADAAGSDFYEGGFLGDFGPWHGANDGGGAGAVVGADADLGHGGSLRPFGGVGSVRGREGGYLKWAAMPIHTLGGRSANFRSPRNTASNSASSSSRR